jgi:hypothetical protein
MLHTHANPQQLLVPTHANPQYLLAHGFLTTQLQVHSSCQSTATTGPQLMPINYWFTAHASSQHLLY